MISKSPFARFYHSRENNGSNQVCKVTPLTNWSPAPIFSKFRNRHFAWFFLVFLRLFFMRRFLQISTAFFKTKRSSLSGTKQRLIVSLVDVSHKHDGVLALPMPVARGSLHPTRPVRSPISRGSEVKAADSHELSVALSSLLSGSGVIGLLLERRIGSTKRFSRVSRSCTVTL